MNPRDHHISLNPRSELTHNRTFRVSRGRNNFFFRQLVVTSATTIKNEQHDVDDVGRTNERTNADPYSEEDPGGMKTGGVGLKKEGERTVPRLKRARENEQKHIREYGRADELPPGRFHRNRCYPRKMTVRAGGRAIREERKGAGARRLGRRIWRRKGRRT